MTEGIRYYNALAKALVRHKFDADDMLQASTRLSSLASLLSELSMPRR